MAALGRFRRWLAQSIAPTPRPEIEESTVRGRYDAAQTTTGNSQHWAASDALDADSANSQGVRRKLTQRSRYEINNNGHAKGIVLTHANYVVGRGPTLRMQTGSEGFNRMVETAWQSWARRVDLARKLRTAIKAKVTDGEALLIAVDNEGNGDKVSLDLRLIETEQCTSNYIDLLRPNKIDGIEFDELGNPTVYEIMEHHPGSAWSHLDMKPRRVPAKWVMHLFREDRPGQHRGIPEITSTLGLFAQGRRWREATVVAAENIANWSVFLKTQMLPSVDMDTVRPLTSLPIDKGMMTALPAGYDAFQPKPEQPSANYDMFNRSMLNEEARPLNMPYNIAAADSSGYSFSGGRLDHLTYFVSLDVEQAEIEEQLLAPVFALWFYEAVLAYQWEVPPAPEPRHGWNWPAKPQIDQSKTANGRKTALAFGGVTLGRIYAEDGADFEDELPKMAREYGVTPDEMRGILLRQIFSSAQEEPEDDEPEEVLDKPKRSNATASRMIHGLPGGNGDN
jgi:lambda family phage portal protein